MISHDSRSNGQTIRDKSLALLKATRDLVAEPNASFAQTMVTHCLQIRFPRRTENKALTEVRSSELPYLSPRIKDGFRKVQLSEFYQSLSGPLPMDIKGVRAFQRDYLAHLDDMISTLERASLVPDSLATPIDQLSGFVLGFCRKERTPSPNRKGASANDIATLLAHTNEVDLMTLKIAISTLMQRDGLESLKAAINPILSRARALGIIISPAMEREVSEWAKKGEIPSISKLSSDERDALIRNLRMSAVQLLRGECGDLMELDWMASVQDAQRDFEYLYDKADRDPARPDHVPEYPEVNYRFARTLRLTMRELNDLKRAAECLQREKLSGLRVEMDQSPFLWPRIAEVILFTRPSEITLHSPTAHEPFEAPSDENLKPFLCQRSMHVVPISLTTSPKRIVEQEIYLANKGNVEWTSRSQGETTLDDRTLSFQIDPNLEVTDAVRALAPHTKLYSNCFVIKDPNAPAGAEPLAFGVIFPVRFVDVPGHTSYTFGKTIQLYIKQMVKAAPIAHSELPSQPQTTETILKTEAPLTSATPSIFELIKTAPSSTPIAPEQPGPPTAKTEAEAPRKVKKAPPPPPVKEPRPRIAEEQAWVAKEVVSALPEIQAAARASKALKPEVPFSNSEVVTTLHILKNGEKPGNKKLKAVLEYVSHDANFRDALESSRLRATREALTEILHALLS